MEQSPSLKAICSLTDQVYPAFLDSAFL